MVRSYYEFSFHSKEEAIKVQVMATNDGRNYSNPLDFFYLPNPTPQIRALL
jgi:hypothetical protein